MNNELYKKLGLGLLNVALPPDDIEIGVSETINDVIEYAHESLTGVISGQLVNSFIEKSFVEENISNSTYDPSAGFKVESTTPMLSGEADIFLSASGLSNQVLSGVQSKTVPSIEDPNRCAVLFKCNTEGTSSFIYTLTGDVSIQSVSQINNNENSEVSSLTNKQVLVKNTNSSTAPILFEMQVLRESDKFNPSDYSDQELAELVGDLNLEGDILTELIESKSSSSSSSSSFMNCFDMLVLN